MEAVEPVEPWVALLPGLDPTTMGWKERDWYLPDAGADTFDRMGNAGPTVWVDGRVVGGWAQAADGEIRTRYLVDVAGRPAAPRSRGARRRARRAAGRDPVHGAVPQPRVGRAVQGRRSHHARLAP